METQIVLVRHGQTEWSKSGQHTGRTDIELTARGREEAGLVAPTLQGWKFAHVFSSPLRRAHETAELAAIGETIEVDNNLLEWDYGVFEGRTNEDILAETPGWSKWDADSIEGGETAGEVGARVDVAIDRLIEAGGDGPVLVFSHGHFLAIFIARWLGLNATDGKRFIIETATATHLGIKRGDHVIKSLNHRCGNPLSQ